MEKVMTSMQGTLLLQQRMSVKMTLVAPLSTSRSQHSGESLVAVSLQTQNTHTHTGLDFHPGNTQINFYSHKEKKGVDGWWYIF